MKSNPGRVIGKANKEKTEGELKNIYAMQAPTMKVRGIGR